jgi:PTS system nitrogen regulatory IIA component
MIEMLTAKEMETLLQVDRSTIYRMAEAGRLPAIKVGKQWRFPAEQVQHWLQANAGPGTWIEDKPRSSLPAKQLADILPLDCVTLIQAGFADLMDVMLVVTDMAGHPLTQVSNVGPFYRLMTESNDGHTFCQEKWQTLGQIPAMTPQFIPTFAGLLCARALIRLGNELGGMVIAFGVAPANWPPSAAAIAELADEVGLPPTKLATALEAAPQLTETEKEKALAAIQRLADILAHIASERAELLQQLESISPLPELNNHDLI